MLISQLQELLVHRMVCIRAAISVCTCPVYHVYQCPYTSDVLMRVPWPSISQLAIILSITSIIISMYSDCYNLVTACAVVTFMFSV